MVARTTSQIYQFNGTRIMCNSFDIIVQYSFHKGIFKAINTCPITLCN